MEVSLLRKSDDIIKEPVLISKSSNLPVILTGDELASGKLETSKCKHFTLRGYVSDLRKREANFFWPFSTLNHTSKGNVNKLPPLLVKKFRRWGCEACVHEAVSSEVPPSNESRTTNPNNEMKNGSNLLPSHHEATKSTSKISEQFKKIKRGMKERNVDCNRSIEDKNLVKELTPCQIEENREGNMLAETTSAAPPLAENTCKTLSCRPEETSFFSDKLVATFNFTVTVSEEKQVRGVCELGKRKESDSYVEKGEALSSVMAHNSRCDSVKKPHHKKSRKVRFLDDILRSEDLHKKDVCASSADSGPSVSGSTKIPDEHPSFSKTTKDEDDQSNTPYMMTQDFEDLEVKKNNMNEGVQANGERGCLIHWVRKACKRNHLHKGDVGAKLISKFAAVRDLDFNHDCYGQAENEHEVMNSSNFVQETSVTRKDRALTADQMKISHPKSEMVTISKKDMHYRIENKDNKHIDLLCRKKNKRPLVEDTAPSYQMQWPKDSLSMEEQASIRSHRDLNKKQRSIQAPEKVAVDGIPKDTTVDLLANKQQERHHMNTKDDSVSVRRLPELSVRTEEFQCKNAGFSAWTSITNNESTECRSKAPNFLNRVEQYRDIDLNQEAPVCALGELYEPSRYAGLSVTGAQLSIFDSTKSYSTQNFANGTKMLVFCPDQTDHTVSSQTMFSNIQGSSSGILDGYTSRIDLQNVNSDFGSNNICFGANSRSLPHNADETLSALNLLRFVDQSANSDEHSNSSMHNDPKGCVRVFNGSIIEYSWSPMISEGYDHELDQQAGNFRKPLRPLPRVGVLGPQLQEEIANTLSFTKSPLGFETRDLRTMPFRKSSFIARNSNEQAYSKTSERDNGEVSPLSSGDGAFQPLRSPEKLGECFVNMNPADFAIVDKDSEYMIGYQETETIEMPQLRTLQSQLHVASPKGKKLRKLNELNRTRTSKKSSLSRLSYLQDAK